MSLLLDSETSQKNNHSDIYQEQELTTASSEISSAQKDSEPETSSELAVKEEETLFIEPEPPFWRLLIPTPNYIATPSLVIVNTIILILMVIKGVSVIAPESEQLINWGANYTVNTLTGQWWRLLTACFLHMGIIHLVMNVLALLSLGYATERIVGSLRFFIIYLIAGIGGSLCSLWWHEQIVSVGASGAIFGILGLSAALVLLQEDEDYAIRKARLLRIGGFIGLNLIYGLKGNIDSAAHMGGLITGFLCGYALRPSLRHPALIKANIGFLTGGAIMIFVILFQIIPKGFAQFQVALSEFTTNEQTIVALYNDIIKSESLAINNSYLPRLEKAIEQCRLNQEKFQELKALPTDLSTRRHLLVRYNYIWGDAFKLLAARIKSNYPPISPDIIDRIDSANYIVQVFENTEPGEEPSYMAENPLVLKSESQASAENQFEGQPLFVLDGKILKPAQPDEQPKELQNLLPSDIANVQVIKEKEFLEQYGADGKNGVVLITTKKKVNKKA